MRPTPTTDVPMTGPARLSRLSTLAASWASPRWLTLYLLLWALLLAPTFLKAQHGPGGVGSNVAATAHQPLIRAWFRADVGVQTLPSGKVTQWNSSGLVALSALADADTTKAPVLIQNALNNRPVVRFNGTNGAYLRGIFPATQTAGPLTFFVVARDFASVNAISGLLTFNGLQGIYYEATAGEGRYVLDGDGTNSSRSSSVLAPTNSFTLISGLYRGTTTATTSIFQGSTHIQTYTGSSHTIRDYNQFEIGGRTWASSAPRNTGAFPGRVFNGDIAEVICFEGAIDSAQRAMVENHLAIKYNLPTSNVRYKYGSTVYRHEMAGIGRAVNGSQHVAGRSSLITVDDPEALGPGRFMTMAHNNEHALTLINNFEMPGLDGTFTRRIRREWRVHKTGGDLGKTRLIIDFSGLESSLPSGFTRGIFIDADGDFRTGAQFVDLLPFSASSYQTPPINIPTGWHITIGAVRRTVSFVSATGSGFENETEHPVIQVQLNYPYPSTSFNTVVVGYQVAPVGPFPADGPGDLWDGKRFNTSRTEAFIMPGQQTVDLNDGAFDVDAALQIHNDGAAQPNTETVRLTINSVIGAELGSTLTHTYFIYDDDFLRKVSLRTTDLPATWNELNAELFHDVPVTLELPPGQGGGPTFVDLVVTGPVKAGLDYRFLDAPDPADSVLRVTFPLGQRIVTTTLRLLGDNTHENNESLTLTLFNPVSGTLSQSDPITHTITIIDNDPPPVASFRQAAAVALESVTTVMIPVRLSEVSGKMTSVPYTIEPTSTATAGADFLVISSSPLFFLPGDTLQYIELEITDDQDEEDDETIVFTIGTPNGATVGTPATHTYTIRDNDVFGDTGPGGVDRSTGGSSLALWMDAANAVTNATSRVTQWSDRSGNAFHATNNDNNRRPTLVADQLNGQPVVRFSAAARTNLRGNFMPSQRTFPAHVYVVARDRGTTSAFGGIFSTNRHAGIYSNAGTQYVADGFTGATLTDATAANSANTPADAAAMSQFAIVSAEYTTASTQGSSLWFNGSLAETHTGPGAGLEVHSSFWIGARNNPEPIPGQFRYFEGDVAEVIYFSTQLTSSRRVLVDNYLSAKYNIPLPASLDRYRGHNPAYTLDVAGIGTLDGLSGNKHRAAQSGGLQVRQAFNSLAGPDRFLMFGHAQPTVAIQIMEVDGQPYEMWSRSWYLDRTGPVSATLTFDYTAVGLLHAPIPQQNYYLFYRATPTGAWQRLDIEDKILIGNRVSFTLTDGELANGYYTMGRTDPITLPVELAAFDVRRTAPTQARLTWTTVSEHDAKHFVIERRTDEDAARPEAPHGGWRAIGQVEAAGFTTSARHYSFTDGAAPRTRAYYRLRQVDRSGAEQLSPIRQIAPAASGLEAGSGFVSVKLVPNPARGQVAIVFSDAAIEGPARVEALDSRGARLFEGQLNLRGGEATLPLTGLAPGVYTLRLTLDSGEGHVRRLVVAP